MTDIGPGTLVECVDDNWKTGPTPAPQTWPKKGRVYTVRAIDGCSACGIYDALRLVEIENTAIPVHCSTCGYQETAEISFVTIAFRPIDHHPEFTEWLESLPERETV